MHEALCRTPGLTLVPCISDDGPPSGPAIIGSSTLTRQALSMDTREIGTFAIIKTDANELSHALMNAQWKS